MRTSHEHSLALHFLLLFLLLFLAAFNISFTTEAQTLIKSRPLNNSVPAIFVFGDSTVDPGNNNFIITLFKSNFPPYGENFPNRLPTGRFTDGRLTTDFIASYVGIKENVPPYLDPTLSIQDLMTGVSFASAGSGFDPLTAKISEVIRMSTQLEYFKEYRKRVERAIGKERTKHLVEKAIFIVSAGTNDFIVNYFTLPIRRQSFTVSSYQQYLMQQIQIFIQDLWDQGARKITFSGLPPMGCLPIVITLNSQNMFFERGCIESYSTVARDYNQMLQKKLTALQNSLANLGAKIVYANTYNPLNDMILSGNKYGFDQVGSGCCGTGLLEASFLCNPKSLVCSDVSKYLFWDSIHPTEKAYYIMFNYLRRIIDYLAKD